MVSCANDDCRVSPSVTGRSKESALDAWNRRYQT
jgi:hypothetical protein